MAWEILLQNMGLLLNGYKMTVIITLISYVIALLFGIVLASIRKAQIKYTSNLVGKFVDLMRSMPLLMVIFWFYFFLPVVTGRPMHPLVTIIVGLSIFYATYIAEVVRAGIASVPDGQMLSAISSGLSYTEVMRFVILPQALRNMVPALMTLFVSLYLSSSLAYIIGVNEFFRMATIINSRAFQSLTIFGFVAFVYFATAYPLSLLSRKLERRIIR